MFLVAGLGNPGPEYADHRHNVGFLVADVLARRWSIQSMPRKFGADVAQGRFGASPILLVKPQQFMNVSGQAVGLAAQFYKVTAPHVIVVHDEIDLDFGRLKVKVGGGHGGHNGVRSIAEAIGPAFIRVRCGVGHPGNKERVVGHVLGPFSKAERGELPMLLEDAADAVESVMRDGVTAAMNRYNTVADKDNGAPVKGKKANSKGNVGSGESKE